MPGLAGAAPGDPGAFGQAAAAMIVTRLDEFPVRYLSALGAEIAVYGRSTVFARTSVTSQIATAIRP
jgi:hypothetical protein